MQWSCIRVEPYNFRAAAAFADSCFTFCLPLISDGRIVLPQLRLHPEWASAERRMPNKDIKVGQVALVDHQLTSIWPNGEQTKLRILGSRFAPGDSVGIRPVGGPIQLFRVSDRWLMDAH